MDLRSGLMGMIRGPSPEKPERQISEEAQKRLNVARDLAEEIAGDYGRQMGQKPFLGAQPKFLKKPEIATPGESARATQVACRTVESTIQSAGGIYILLGEDAKHNGVARELLDCSSDEPADAAALVSVQMSLGWLHSLPSTGLQQLPPVDSKLYIWIGTPGKYLSQSLDVSQGKMKAAYNESRLVVLCKGACMLPLGAQEQNVFGVDENEVLKTIAAACRAKGAIAWGHGVGTKAVMMQRAYGYPIPADMPKPLDFSVEDQGHMIHMDYFDEYVKYLNLVKMAKPNLPVVNYYDTGLIVSVLTRSIAARGTSILTDRDGLAMLREASIGHIVSKLNQLVAVKYYSTNRGVYNFFCGDGASRLNNGAEQALHLIEGYRAQSLMNFFIFNNNAWAIEDNLVADQEQEHKLFNTEFYNLLGQHGSVCICENDGELRDTLAFLSKKTADYLAGEAEPGLFLVVVRGINLSLPPMLGDINSIRDSSEMAFLRNILAKFSEGCKSLVPIYGCSAFEYVQYLHFFMNETPEGKAFQYVCGRTDIQAAHMCGFEQPDGRCVLFMNDVHGINALGESLRLVLSGFGGKQLLILIWHPTLQDVIDHFHLHRPPMVWPSVGPEICKYYVRKESDALFVDFEGGTHAAAVTSQVNEALAAGTPLVCVNVLPEQERNFISLDIRVKTA